MDHSVTPPILIEENGKSKKNKKGKKRKVIKRIISAVLILSVVGGAAFGFYRLFHEEEEEKELWTDFVYTGSIQTSVTGSGVTKAKDAVSLTLPAAGTVLDVFVVEGDLVQEGDLLYRIDSTDAVEAVQKAQDAVDDYQKQIDTVQGSIEKLVISAPFSGKLTDITTLMTGNDISAGTKLATLVDDSTMLLTLYFSYAYERDIFVGQAATVSVPSTMADFPGTVDAIHKVEYVSPEGGTFLEVDIRLNNPGAFTEGTAASAVLKSASGGDIYPYASGSMQYAQKTDVLAETSGEILTINLRNYQRVSAGQLLMQISDENCAQQLAALRTEMRAAEETLSEARERLSSFRAVAPMSGTVLQCSLTPGSTGEAGQTAVSIADVSTMCVEAQIDEMNVAFAQPGMTCDIIQWGRDGEQHFVGTVESVSMEGKHENGVSFFPATITVDNTNGLLLSGMYVDYSIAASQSENCLIVPVQAVKYTEAGTCLFVRAETAPENTIDTEAMGLDVPEGFYAIPVTVGLSDNTSAEIVSGVEDGMEVFVQYMMNQGDSYGGGKMW